MKGLRTLFIVCFAMCVSTFMYAFEKANSKEKYIYEKNKQTDAAYEIISGWKIFGDVRVGWVQYDYQNSPKNPNPNINKSHLDSKGIYTMPKLSLQSPLYNGFMLKATLVGATDFGINDEDYESRNFVFDPTVKKSFMLLQEGFLYYEYGKNYFLIGREELATPMIDTDDWYMLANSFEVLRYSNSYFKNTKIGLGYFHKMAGVWDSGAKEDKNKFNSMAESSYLDQRDKDNAQGGIAFASLVYDDKKHNNLQIWEYYGFDLYNIFFVQYDYKNTTEMFSYDVGVQLINFKDVGGNRYTKIDYSLLSARFDGEFNNGINFATGISKYTDGEGQGATLGAFGGYPYFANGMIFHFFEAGSLQNAASYKVQVGYNLSNIGLAKTWLGYRFTYFDLDSGYSKSTTGKNQNSMKLNGIRLTYGSDVGAYFTGTYEHVNLDAEPNTFSLRLIGGYRF